MSSNRLNAAEKDLEKFIKFLALKSTQVVVQSRLGEKIQTQCNPLASGSDWFNMVIQDHPDVYAETKKALNLSQGESILQRLPLSVEISLKTVEGDQMILEVWSLDLQQTLQQQQRAQGTDKVDGKADSEQAAAATNNQKAAATINNQKTANGVAANSTEYTLKAAHAIYNRMGILLKSLISLTRATPAYKLSRRQSADSYGIYYRIYVDKPQIHMLGEGYKNVKIGQLNTIVGTISMSVAYRTKMTITPTTQQPGRVTEAQIMLKSDHFRRDVTPQQGNARFHHIKKAAERKVIDIEKPLRPGAFTDISKLKQYTEDDFILPETPPFDWLLKRTRHESGCSSGGSGSLESLNRKSASPTSPLGNGHQHNINNNAQASVTSNNNANNNNNVIAFKSFENEENLKSNSSLQSPIKSLLVAAVPAPALSSAAAARSRNGSTSTLPPNDEDNLLKELNFPFASPTSHVNDLAKFYRDCYHAPPLLGLSVPCEMSGLAEAGSCAAAANVAIAETAVDDLSKQLELFETSLEDYDKLVSQLTLTTSSSTESRNSGLQMSN